MDTNMEIIPSNSPKHLKCPHDVPYTQGCSQCMEDFLANKPILGAHLNLPKHIEDLIANLKEKFKNEPEVRPYLVLDQSGSMGHEDPEKE